jgi:hypothetical protein
MPVPPPIICTQHPNKNIKIKVENTHHEKLHKNPKK